MDSDICQRLAAFKADLAAYDTSTITQKYITYGDCYVLCRNSYFDLKSKVAAHFGFCALMPTLNKHPPVHGKDTSTTIFGTDRNS